MARSHHRRKHKHFQPPPHTTTHKQKGRASTVFLIAGAILGFLISYSATGGNWIWIAVITILIALLGYFIGHNIDKSGEKK